VSARDPLVQPGASCLNDFDGVAHVVLPVGEDLDLQLVHMWLASRPLDQILTRAVTDAIEYVLDGSRTWRFDLNGPDVDSDERRTVGTKLQYRILAGLELEKEPPLDTTILEIPVELKATVGDDWMIPREGQCQISLLSQVDTVNDRHRAFLMRTHRVWLNAPNHDKKRGIKKAARREFALPLIGWTPLPVNPLKMLTTEQRGVVFAPGVGQARRLTSLFGFLPGRIIPRTTILTVCANREDPLRRARQIKEEVRREHGLLLLCGKWKADRMEARARGYELGDKAWIALKPV
jgi:hypothetical protein